jgi:hypothetical protein
MQYEQKQTQKRLVKKSASCTPALQARTTLRKFARFEHRELVASPVINITNNYYIQASAPKSTLEILANVAAVLGFLMGFYFGLLK